MPKSRTIVGIGWAKKFSNGGSVINLSLNLEKLLELPMDKFGNVFVEVNEASNPGERSKETHSVYVDEYRKNQLLSQKK